MRVLVIAVGVLSLSACAFQSSSKVGEPRRGEFGPLSLIPLDGHHDVRGELAGVHQDRVVIHTRQGPVHLHTDEDTTVFTEGRVGTLADLRDGEPVRASVQAEEGRNVALWIEVPSRKPEKKKEKGDTP